MINENILKGKWNEIKGEVKRAWGNLTDNEIDETKGSAQSLMGLIQKKYGVAQSETETKLNGIIANFGEKDSMTDRDETVYH